MRTTKDVKQNKGITLIALVITIIVMLILVAVTITMAVKGGLFDYASRAGTKTNEAVKAEQELGSGRIKIGGTWYDSPQDYVDGKPSANQGDETGNEGEKPEKPQEPNNPEGGETPEEPQEPSTPEEGDDDTPSVALSEINIGDYISNYPVDYTNVVDIDEQEFTKWRVLSKETDSNGNITNIKIISAGVPLTYSSEVIGSVIGDVHARVDSDLKTNFLNIQVNSETVEAYKFHKCGFNLPAGTNTLSSVFTNGFTDKVQSLTTKDLGGILGKYYPTSYGEVDPYTLYTNISDLGTILAIPLRGDSAKCVKTALGSRGRHVV